VSAAHVAAGRKGAHTSWANTVNRSARTETARAKSPTSIDWHLDRLSPAFDDATPEQRYDAAESARKAYMTGLAIRSAAARRRAS
jgi:hypothetical protein